MDKLATAKMYSKYTDSIISVNIIPRDGKFVIAEFTDWNKETRRLLFKKSSGLQPNTKKHDYQLLIPTL